MLKKDHVKSATTKTHFMIIRESDAPLQCLTLAKNEDLKQKGVKRTPAKPMIRKLSTLGIFSCSELWDFFFWGKSATEPICSKSEQKC